MVNEARKIQSVERAFHILEVLSNNESPMSLQRLSIELDIHKTTLHGLLNTMVALGYVNNSDFGYSLGMRLVELSRPVSKVNDQLRIQFEPLIREMAIYTGNTAYLAVLCGSREYLYIDAIEGEHPLTIRSPRGRREGLTTSAIGKLFLALETEHDLRRSLRKVGKLEPLLENQLDEIVTKGFSIDHEGAQKGLSCMSIPLYHENKLVAAAGISGPSLELNTDCLTHYAAIFLKKSE